MPITFPFGAPPAPAADIVEAIDFAQANVHFFWDPGTFPANTLRTKTIEWVDGFRDEFDPANPNERALHNWTIPAYRQAALVSDVAPTITNADDVGNLVWRMLNAVRQAQIDGDITAAKRDAILALFNATWV